MRCIPTPRRTFRICNSSSGLISGTGSGLLTIGTTTSRFALERLRRRLHLPVLELVEFELDVGGSVGAGATEIDEDEDAKEEDDDDGEGASAIGGMGATLTGVTGEGEEAADEEEDAGAGSDGAEFEDEVPPLATATAPVAASLVSESGSLMFETGPPGIT